jgi:glutathione S-transferase
MYKLYGTKHTGTCAVHAALEELNTSYEMVEVTTKTGQHLTDDYKKINPRQQVPSLMLPDGTVITEGPAILIHLADTHSQLSLIPSIGTVERSQIVRWLFFFAVNVYEGELRKLFGARFTTDPNGGDAVVAAAEAYVNQHYEIFENILGEGPFFLGDEFTVLDIYVWMLAQWMDRKWLGANCPKILLLADTVKGRPKIAPIQRMNFG